MQTLVPFAADRPKTRLDGALTAEERAAFAREMLSDVLAAVRGAGGEPTVLATAPVDVDAPVTVDERPLTAAVNAALAETVPTEGDLAVVMADLALATPRALRSLFETDGDVVLVPGRGGGTNAVVVRDPAFRVDYHGASIRDHRAIAEEADLSVAELDSFRLATDVDEPADLAEVLLHGDGHARAWLVDAGFEVSTVDGRVRAERG